MSNNVDQIKERLDLVDTISSYIKLEKAGLNYKACCPFHNEKSPSFFVSPSKNIWHCFSCGTGGDIISFVMEIEHIEFIEALKILAKRAGIELKKEDPKIKSERDRMFGILEETKNFYKSELLKNKNVLDYLTCERGLNTETIKDFEIGYSSDSWRNIYEFLRQKNYSDAEIEKAGLIIKKNQISNLKFQIQNQFYDRFRNRIMFPINDQSGRTVAFGGRIFNLPTSDVGKFGGAKQEPAKYINSPETPLYNKSRILYGFDKAKIAIVRDNSCVLVEGYMDAIMSHQAGVKNTVAVSGTALTSEHLNLISRLTKKVIMSFDADEAGHTATKRSVDILLSQGFEVNVAVIKEKDPADLIKNLGPKEGPFAWQKALKDSFHVIDFYLNFLIQKYGKDKRIMSQEIIKIIFPYFLLISNEMERSYWFKKISVATDVKEDSVWQEFEKFKKNSSKNNNFAGQDTHGSSFKKDSDTNYANAKNADFKTDNFVNKKKKYLEERVIGILSSLYLEGLIDEEIKNKIKDYEKMMSPFTAQILNSILREQDVLKGEEILKLKTLALETELIYNNKEEMKDDLLNLFNSLKKEEKREKLEILTNDIRKLEKINNFENQKSILQKVEEFNKISKEF